jgi:fucose permease
LVIPAFTYNLPAVLLSFALIGIGNTILQVAINPLLTDIIPVKLTASSLTFGQFTKSISSFLGPVIAGFASLYFHNWKLIFPVFAVISLLTAIWLYSTKVEESVSTSHNTTIRNCLTILKKPAIPGLFIGIIFVVGLDVGLNASLPKYLMHRAGISLEQAGIGTSLYFAAKIAGNFLGTFILTKVTARRFLSISIFLAIIALAEMLLAKDLTGIYIGIIATGLALSNIFALIFSIALVKIPEKKNEISGLMVMGIAGGAIIPVLMGLISDSLGQNAAIVVLFIPLIYLLINSLNIKTKESELHINKNK